MTVAIENADVADLPPSSKVVYLILLGAERPLEFGEIRERGNLPKGTMQGGLRRLREADVIIASRSLVNPGNNWYTVPESNVDRDLYGV